MKREAISHTKMKRLCRRLDIPLWQGVGLLESIWHLTAREAPRGDIGKLSDEDIALGIDYHGDEGALIDALVSCGWIDRDPVARLCIHDWHEHTDDHIHNRLARAHLHFAGGRPPKLTRLPSKEREIATKFYDSCAQNADPCVQQAHETHTESARQALDERSTNVPPEPEPEPEPLPEPEPEAARVPSAPLVIVQPIRSQERKVSLGGISPAAWEDFRNRYAESGKKLNESDWNKAAMEVASLGLSETNLVERVIPSLVAELPEWGERELSMIPYPANWLKSQPWTRIGKPREPPLTREERKQAEIDRQWAELGLGGGNGTQ
jgi:hypothetical protein